MGNAIADVIFGKVSPAGRLVQTWITSIDQLPPILDYNIRHGRTYMYNKDIPLFPFGYGLTYTSFKYSGLTITGKSLKEDGEIDITFDIENTGNFDSDEVPQLYVSFPESSVEMPARALKGFRRIFIARGAKVSVTLPLKADDLRYWDAEKDRWTLPHGKVRFYIGPSSVESRLEGEITTR